jgi:hypothetical protein
MIFSTHMDDVKNGCLAAASYIGSHIFNPALLQADSPLLQTLQGLMVPVLLFAVGKGVDLLFQHYWKKREERRAQKLLPPAPPKQE